MEIHLFRLSPLEGQWSVSVRFLITNYQTFCIPTFTECDSVT